MPGQKAAQDGSEEAGSEASPRRGDERADRDKSGRKAPKPASQVYADSVSESLRQQVLSRVDGELRPAETLRLVRLCAMRQWEFLSRAEKLSFKQKRPEAPDPLSPPPKRARAEQPPASNVAFSDADDKRNVFNAAEGELTWRRHRGQPKPVTSLSATKKNLQVTTASGSFDVPLGKGGQTADLEAVAALCRHVGVPYKFGPKDSWAPEPESPEKGR
eukprot:TRINITY_DN5263_c4_g1_i1.p1 TRINITY_DN5263_c4_g1~~TRINITY_DN5263_c4_g1_i1.p1  ORF type:complete len:217 (+),score=65.63 TRINITY_DN5263_c4_g1_i1:129-779(+)